MEETHKKLSWFRSLLMTGLSLGLAASPCRGAEIVFIQGPNEDPVVQVHLELTARFYGLDLRTLNVRTRNDVPQALTLLRNGSILAAVVSADALPNLPKNATLSSLRRRKARNVPLLITGVKPQTDTQQLADWSGGALLDCHSLAASFPSGSYAVGSASQITRELTGQEIPASTFPVCAFAADAKRGAQLLLSFRGKPSGQAEAVLVRVKGDSEETFFLSETRTSDVVEGPQRMGTVQVFSELLPLMMFVRYAAGDSAWHSEGYYANLTIDDAWLTEPYGHLNYEALLHEMEVHNFHTTIAFIPWNFDRSEPKLVQFLREHSDRFSFSVHGNNHDHIELGSYDQKPLSGQVAGIRQALARMERFRTLTALPFDPVMVFPQEVVAPVPTLRKLKEYGFVAATNAVTVPIGATQPTDPLFSLKAVTLDFADFPLVRRYPAGDNFSKPLIAINAFLNNPILFYGHESLFTNGIAAFDSTADSVNQIAPTVRWESLGSISEHLYLLKLRDDASYDVQAFSNNLIVRNPLRRDVTFYVEKKEEAPPAIKSLTVNDKPWSYELSGGYLRFVFPVSAGNSAHLAIEYQNDLNLAAIDVSRKSLRVALLRWVSDFRDLSMSRSTLGRAMTRLYYQRRLDDLELKAERSLPIVLVLIVGIFGVTWVLRRRARAKNPEAACEVGGATLNP